MAVAALNTATAFFPPRGPPCPRIRRECFGFRCRSSLSGEEEYLVDAPVSIGDGFSFSGGKYAEGSSRFDEWFAQGKMVDAHPAYCSKGKAKDPIFGLTMGGGSQTTDDVFRWFCVEVGDSSNPSIILIHGFPSQVLGFLINLNQDMASIILLMSMFHLWDLLLMSSKQIIYPLLCRGIFLL